MIKLFEKFGWLKVLKNSLRNSRLVLSVTWNLLKRDISRFSKPGPCAGVGGPPSGEKSV